MSGGSFVAELIVGGGEKIRVTVDTGAACYLAIGSDVASKFRTGSCVATGKVVHQLGANGERVCAHVITTSVQMAGQLLLDVPVLVNHGSVPGEDGYVGYCFLRHFDLCVTSREMLARRNDAPLDLHMLDGTFDGASACGEGPPRQCTST